MEKRLRSKLNLTKYNFTCQYLALMLLKKFFFSTKDAGSTLGYSPVVSAILKEIKLCDQRLSHVYSRGVTKPKRALANRRRRFLFNRHELKYLGTRGMLPYLKRGSW